MRIATWNIGGCFILDENSKEYSIESVQFFCDQLNALEPDVVCLQEAHLSQIDYLTKECGYLYSASKVIAESHLKTEEKLTIAILSKYPIISEEFCQLSNPNLVFEWKGKPARSHDKGLLVATLQFNQMKLRIISGHMVPWRKYNRSPLELDFKHIQTELSNVFINSDLPTIAGIDLNWNDVHALLPKVFEAGFTSLIEGELTTPRGGMYDKILTSPHCKNLKSTVVRGKADHYLCYSDIDIQS